MATVRSVATACPRANSGPGAAAAGTRQRELQPDQRGNVERPVKIILGLERGVQQAALAMNVHPFAGEWPGLEREPLRGERGQRHLDMPTSVRDVVQRQR